MNILSIVIILFIVLEALNVFMLYFTPGTKRGNGLGVFNAYERSKSYSDVYPLVQYLINWVAGTKLIFILLLIVVLIFGDTTIKIYSIGSLIISISLFYWRLFPAIKALDKDNQITPKGYSKTLGIMITCFISIFIIALFLHISMFN